MSVLKPDRIPVSDVGHYQFSDYEDQKKAYLDDIRQQGEKIILDARAKARELLQEAYKKGIAKAREEIDREMEECKKTAHEEGFAKGEAEAKQKVESENVEAITPVLSSLEKSLSELETQKSTFIDDAKNQLIDSALVLAKSVISCEVKTNKDVLQSRLLKALDYLNVQLRLEIHLHPSDLQKAKEIVPQIIESIGSQPIVKWIEDQNLSPSDVLVTTGDSTIHLDTELQWEKLINSIHEKGILDPSTPEEQGAASVENEPDEATESPEVETPPAASQSDSEDSQPPSDTLPPET